MLNRLAQLQVYSLLDGRPIDLDLVGYTCLGWHSSCRLVSHLITARHMLIRHSLSLGFRHKLANVDDGQHGLRNFLGYHADFDHRVCGRDLSYRYARIPYNMGLDVLGLW